MAYDLAKVTDAGNSLVAGIIADKSSLSIDKIEVSNTQLPSTTDITKLTSISNVVQTIQANGFSKNDNTLIISSVLDNSKVSTDYKAWVFGVWGSDSQNGKSILMAVITSTTSPDTIPAYSGSTPVSYTYKFNIGFSNAANVQFNMINGSFATNDTVVHNTGNENIDGQKTFKVDPVDKNGDAYITGKGIPSNIATLDDVAKKVTDNKDGSIVVNGKTFVPADDSAVVHKSGDEKITGNKNFTGDLQHNGVDVADMHFLNAKSGLTDFNWLNSRDGIIWVYMPAGSANAPDATNDYLVHTIYRTDNYMIQQAMAQNVPDTIYQRTYQTNHWTNWHAISSLDTSKLVNMDGSDDGNITNTKLTVKDGQMFLDGYPIMAYGVATDKDDATAKSAKYPGVMFIW